jgi:site-specific recombinase XerD
MQAADGSVRAAREGEVDAALAQLFGAGVRPLRMEEALFDAVLVGWRRQGAGRHLAGATLKARDGIARRFRSTTALWPWQWRSVHVDEWMEDLSSPPRRLSVSTLRSYQGALRGFMEYLVDERYPWAAICEREFGSRPVQILDDSNAIGHVVEYEGDPRRRPFTREELTGLFDHLDAKVTGRRALGRKGSLAAFRDAVAFKTIYAWGLRRQEAVRLDLTDFGRNPHRPSFEQFGRVNVRYGKASRGSAPKRRNVLTVFPWSVDVLEQYVTEIRPLYGMDQHPALFVTERGGRLVSEEVSKRFAVYRDELGLPVELTLHSLRHSYVTHLIEDGWDELFVRMQVGHRFASTTAIYTGVSGDYKNEVMRRALRDQLARTREGSER